MDVYDPVRADEDRKTWQQVRAMCDRMLEMYNQMPVQLTMDAADDSSESA